METKRSPILVIDDDSSIVDLITATLRGTGYESVGASNGLEGLKKLVESDPHLVILDVNMPHLDGMQTCRLIRAKEQYRNIPILMLTARGDITDMMEARKMGADDYLVKPFEKDMLINKVERLLAR
ncbi:MAG TPA: response regulator [Acidobacteriota bacterium]|nr:response regulator [Acidobacteriota bacterium]